MNKITTIALLILSITTSISQNNAAGVLPYYIDSNKEISILLGLESGYLEDFIGGYEDYDGGDLIETATREFHQETNCFFEKDVLRKKIFKSRDKSVQLRKGIYRFIIEVKYVNPEEIKNAPVPCVKYVEKSDWIWVKLSTLEDAIRKSKSDLDVIITYDENGKKLKLDKKMKSGLLPKSPTMNYFNSIRKSLNK